MVSAVGRADFPVVQAGVLTMAVITVLLTLITDIGVAMIDPRIKAGLDR
jgi:ABC-type dipeptide/oligopeptide/nickel transport system permease component